MKRLLCILPFLLAACDSGVTGPRESVALSASTMSAKGGSCTLASGKVASTGFDKYGYNRCAHIFNGTFEGYCAARGGGPSCGGVEGTTKLIMKWNEEWDRGNAEGWTKSPYAAYLDNEMRGTYLDGTPFSEHFKTRWDAGCVATFIPDEPGIPGSGFPGVSTNGGACIWEQFEVLMDQGTENGEHIWWTKLTPAGYGN